MTAPSSAGFVLRLAWRETRGAGRHFAYLVACITLGVGALVAVGSFAAGLERTVGRSARALMGGDVEIRSTHPLSAAARDVVADLTRDGAESLAVTELAAMSAAGGKSQIVELKAVGPGYPFYGALVTDPAAPEPLVGGGRALVHQSLLARLGLRVGDRFTIGEGGFTVSGVIVQEPDRAVGVFSLGPRVLIDARDLESTHLIRPGSRVRYRLLVRLAPGFDAEAFKTTLAARLIDPAVRVTTYTHAQPGVRRFWGQLTVYLGLTGLVALMVGGIGVATSVRAFVRGKLETIAVLKCLGAGWRQVLAAYLCQTVLLGLGGSLLGAALGSAIQWALAPALAPLLPVPLDAGLSPRAILTGLAMGTGLTLLFALWPLLDIRRVPPALILRHSVEPRLPGRRPWLAAVPIVLGLAALAIWEAGSLKVGGIFIGGLAAALVLLAAGARLVIEGARRLPRLRSLAWRQAVANLHRPGSHAGTVLVSLGLAVMLIVAVALLEQSLRAELADRGPGRAPAFFFIDIQPDQVAAFRTLVADKTGREPTLTPVVRSRLAAINGAPVSEDPRQRREEVWYLSREYVLTWAAAPPAENPVVAGRWWTAEEAQREPLISVEEEIAKNLGVAIGGTLAFDIQGVTVTARVANLRRVEWQTFNTNFFVIFSQGALDGAPTTWLATARVPPADELAVQSAVTAAFPNVTAIPIREVLERIAGVLDQIALAIRLLAGVSIATGLIVTAGALGVSRHQRLYQSVILKALGATRGLVARVFAVEYALLGAAAGLGGTALAAALAAGVLHWALDVPWAGRPATLAWGVAASTLLALAVGFLGTFRLLGRKPLAVLRSE
ncbi:MAG TPA: FtsX-like permease family protein [Candidatus Bathyarchaeia archaeon]|nr:FtsX-like permease family protein [Candidatus Bathyarchaeia archaeon]